MTSAFIMCTVPPSLAADGATAWLERRAAQLRRAEPVAEVTVRGLHGRRREPIWLVHVVLRSDEGSDSGRLLSNLVRDLRRLGMRLTVSVDERSQEWAADGPGLQRAA
jgi:hypothetical protein